MIVAAELRTRFELVAYRQGPGSTVAWRRDLGPSDYDVTALAYDPRGRRVWVAVADGTVRAFDARTGEPGPAWALGARATGVAIVDDGRQRYLVTATSTGVLCLRRGDDGALLQCVVAHRGAISDVAVHGQRVASVSVDGTATVWDVPSLRRLRHTTLSQAIVAVAFSPSGQLALVTHDGPLRRTPAIAARERRGFPAVAPRNAVVVWSRHGRLERRAGHRAAISDVVWLDDRRLLTSSWDRTVRLWHADRRGSRVVARTPFLVHGLARGSGVWVLCAWAPSREDPATQVVAIPAPARDERPPRR